MFTRADQNIVIAPWVLRQATNIAIVTVAFRNRRNFRFGHQRLQPLLGGRILPDIHLIVVQTLAHRLQLDLRCLGFRAFEQLHHLRHRDGRWFWHWDPAFLKPTNDDPFVRVEQLEQAAVELTIPILLIRGKLSDVVSPEGVQEFLARVPAAEFVELSDAGHTAAGDDNDAFSEVVVEFVTR